MSTRLPSWLSLSNLPVYCARYGVLEETETRSISLKQKVSPLTGPRIWLCARIVLIGGMKGLVGYLVVSWPLSSIVSQNSDHSAWLRFVSLRPSWPPSWDENSKCQNETQKKGSVPWKNMICHLSYLLNTEKCACADTRTCMIVVGQHNRPVTYFNRSRPVQNLACKLVLSVQYWYMSWISLRKRF